MREVVPDLVDDVVWVLAFDSRNRRHRLEVGKGRFEILAN